MGWSVHSLRSRRAVLAIAVALLALVTAVAPAVASHSRFERVSAGALNGNGGFDASFRGASSDGTRIFFVTDEPLVKGDLDAVSDIYERSGGTTTRVSAGAVNGNGAINPIFRGASSDGTRVFFETSERLVTADTDNFKDVYQRSGGVTTQLSAGAVDGNWGYSSVTFSGASSDGTRVFLRTVEQLVSADTDLYYDIYERVGGTITRVSAGAVNGNGAFTVNFAGASSDGTRVFFTTTEPLVAADTDSSADIYERSGGLTTQVSAGAVNGNGAFGVTFRRSSGDGTRVFFETTEPLVAADTDTFTDIYQRSGGATTQVSAGAVNGNSAWNATFSGASSDGSRIFFVTTAQLVTSDTDNFPDIYERSGGTTTRVSAGAVNGNGAFTTEFRGASSDGTRVFFTTFERLVAADTDGVADVYQRSGGSTTWISAGAINGNGSSATSFAGASSDGTRVFFKSNERLVAADTDLYSDIYERSGGTTSVLTPGNGSFSANFHRTSDDGSAVFFSTPEKVIIDDEDGVIDIYGAFRAP